jgi:N-acyl-D-amino-acid deacylase
MDDILIRGATVLDGTGGPPQCADVAVRQGRISAFDAGRTETAAREIDATGLMLAPGFIDIHTHSDFTLPLNPMAEAKIRQGVIYYYGGRRELRLLGCAGFARKG